MNLKHIPVLSLLSLSITAAYAAPDTVFNLGEVLVTGQTAAGPVMGGTILDSEDMRRNDRITVGEALTMAPGVSLSKIGGRNEQMVYVRGYDLRQVPVYVDGIPVYVPYDGYVDLGRFTTFDIARIDVAKGFSSSLYGANTLGGAINLISRRPASKFEGEVGGGINAGEKGGISARHVYANVGTNQGSWYLQTSLSYVDQDFFALPSDFRATATEDGGKRDNSSSSDRKGSIKLGLTPNATDEYAIGYINQHGAKDVPSYTGTLSTVRNWRWPNWDKESIYFLSKTQLDNHLLKFRVYHDKFQNTLHQYTDSTYRTLRTGGSAPSFYNDYTNGLGIEDDIRISDRNQLRVAYNLKIDVHRENTLNQPVQTYKDRLQTIAIEDTHAFSDRLSLITGLSFQHSEVLRAQHYDSGTGAMTEYGRDSSNATNGQIGINYKLTATEAVHASFARKTRFATIKDRYSYRMGTAIPNPGLQPEKANHWEVGYRGKLGDQAALQANLFHSRITDMIQMTTLTPAISQQQNVGKVEVSGVELDLRGSVGRWDIGGNYTYLDRKNRSNDNKLTDTPKHNLFAFATWNATDNWNLHGSIDASSKRYSNTTGTQVVHGFAVANLKTGHRFAKGLTLEAGVRNLFDRLYEYSEGFPEAGRTYFLQFNQQL